MSGQVGGGEEGGRMRAHAGGRDARRKAITDTGQAKEQVVGEWVDAGRVGEAVLSAHARAFGTKAVALALIPLIFKRSNSDEMSPDAAGVAEDACACLCCCCSC